MGFVSGKISNEIVCEVYHIKVIGDFEDWNCLLITYGSMQLVYRELIMLK